MNHEKLHAYMDGELDAQDRAAVETALAHDPVWADAYAALVALDAAVEHAWDPAPVPAGSDAAHGMARAIIATDRRARRGRVLAFSAAASAIAAALLLTLLPTVRTQSNDPAMFTDDESAGYVYWESDAETYGTGDLSELEDQILDVLAGS